MVASTLTEIPEEKRVMIRNATQRINDIANSLLQKGKTFTEDKGTNLPASNKAVEFIPALVDILVSEKRMQFREHNSLDIQTDLKNSFGSFSEINSTELKRVISNLINNAVEAFDNFKGTITVGVQKCNATDGPRVEIFVADNGKGIPAHLISKLGQMGVSHGKSSSSQSGSGLGLYHAKQTAESCGGTLEITSTEGKGSTIKFILPLAEAPKWFAQKIDFTGKKYLVSLDDDTSIHQIWAGRLQSLSGDPLFKNIEHIKFQSGEAFEKYVYANMPQLKETLFLIDFELLNQQKTGLDLIEELGLEKYGVLVTSRYEEKNIQERAARINLQLLPKALAGLVPFVSKPAISGSAQAEIPSSRIRYYLCLIDDDTQLVHAVWASVAESKGLKIKMFANPQDFLAAAESIDRQTPIYIDVSLGDGIKGTDVAEEIHKLGFVNINLATGYEADSISAPSFIRQIVGKDFPELDK